MLMSTPKIVLEFSICGSVKANACDHITLVTKLYFLCKEPYFVHWAYWKQNTEVDNFLIAEPLNQLKVSQVIFTTLKVLV